jgi:hypothetical protein
LLTKNQPNARSHLRQWRHGAIIIKATIKKAPYGVGMIEDKSRLLASVPRNEVLKCHN